MKTKIIVILLVFLLIPTILAEDFKVELKPHYFKDGRMVLKNTSYNGIVFEISGTNSLEKSRILELQIVDASPQIFKDALNYSTSSLRILQERILWLSNLMDIDDFIEGNITFWIEVKGVNEKTNKELIAVDSTILFIKILKKLEQKDPWITSLGDKIWEDNWEGGLLILVVSITVVGFVWWRYNGSDKLDKWRDRAEQKRAEQKEEGF